jgi:sugar (pentulose or hexulose) kinase
MKRPLVLAFDIGTQSTRVMLIDQFGNILHKVQKQYEEPYYSSNAGWAEQKPQVYWETMKYTCNHLKLLAQDEWEDITCVTCTTIRDTCLCLDSSYSPLRDVIVWLDKRKAACCKNIPLINRILFKIVGMQEAVKLQREVSYCNWIAENEKEIWDKTNKFVLLSAYLNYLMTGILKDSKASSIGHIPFDNKRGEWMKKNDLTRCIFNVRDDQMCELADPGDIIGYITKEASEYLSIPVNTPLIATGSDKGCETLGLSVISDDQAALSFGTTATIQFMTEKYMEPLPFLPAYSAVLKKYYNPEIQIYRGFWLVSWFKNQFCDKEKKEAENKGIIAEDLLNEKMKEVPVGCDGLVCNPYFTAGVSMPVAKGAFIGFSDMTTKYHIYRSIIEGINFALYEGKQVMEKRGRRKIKSLFLAGGGSKSPVICQITADIFGLPVHTIQTNEAGALGSAIVAFTANKIFNNIQDAIDSMVHVKHVYMPDIKNHEKYMKIYNMQFIKIFNRLLPLYRKNI